MKIAIKNDGNIATGVKILNILVNLGGKNEIKFFGHGNRYYYIDGNNIIQYISNRPSNYICYNSLEDYLNSKSQIINYSDI